MQNDFIDMIEPTPILHSKRCKLISLFIRIFLQFSTYFFTFIAWFIYDYFIAFLTLILSFVIVGIIRSKLRNSVIPLKQREYHYNDKGIADWYTAKELCVETEQNISTY
jgi:ABC-type multidrug transport system fused ATPase/permease subunit